MPEGQPIVVRLPNGETKEYAAGTPVQLIQAEMRQLAQTQPQLFVGPGDQAPEHSTPDVTMEPREFLGNLASGAGTALELASTLMPGGVPIRTAVSGLAGLASGALKGEENPMWRAATNAGLEGAFGKVAEALPYMGSRVALATGGLSSHMRPRAKQIAEGFVREGQRLMGRGKPPLAVGNTTRTEKLTRQAGQRMADIESNLPGNTENPVYLPGVLGSKSGLIDEALLANDPMKLRDALNDDEWKFLMSHLQARKGRPGGEEWVSLREAGELGRRQRKEARDFYKARREGEWITPDDDALQQAKAARGESLFDLQEHAAQSYGAGKDLARLKDARKEFSDLAQSQEANWTLRGGPSAWGVRGGLGAGMGSSLGTLGYLSGVIEPTTALGLGATTGLLSSILLSPRNASRLGWGLGAAARMSPTAGRLAEGGDDLMTALEELKQMLGNEMPPGPPPPTIRRRSPK